MSTHKIAVKFFVDDAAPVSGDVFVTVFHRWIQQQAVTDHLLVDVADYAHVPDGPGTLLVAHEANIAMDRDEGRLGLLYQRKQPLAGDFATRLRTVVAIARDACRRLESDPSLKGMKFRTDQLLIRLNDRLAAPNTNETLQQHRRDIEAVAAETLGVRAVTLQRPDDPRVLFQVLAVSA